jgi:gluconokinase
MIVVVMGVAGSGKTTVGGLLARSLQWRFFDADDLHSAANREKMRRGIALTEADRGPWLEAVRDLIERSLAAGDSCVVACSALKRSYRERLVGRHAAVKVAYLDASYELVSARLAKRPGHFFNPGLLQNQFDLLEEPSDAIVVDAATAPEVIVAAIRDKLSI